ncbi:putative carboxylesterase [Helianthus annuus]|nr:putative carboxylesterase [Helianthus annuus]
MPNLTDEATSSFGVTSRPEDTITAANLSFTDGVATKDIHIDLSSCLSNRIFLPNTCLVSSNSDAVRVRVKGMRSEHESRFVAASSVVVIDRDELGTVQYRYRKNRYRKSPKVGAGTEYTRFGTVRYRYLRLKTGKYRYRTGTVPDRTGTENAKSRYRIGTEKVPSSVNSVPVPGTLCSSLVIEVGNYL